MGVRKIRAATAMALASLTLLPASSGATPFFGSMGGQRLDAPIVAMAATPSGSGYWLAASDGGVFSFGDARFFGSMGGQRLDSPIVDVEPVPGGRGYWLLGGDGGTFSFGAARFRGSAAGAARAPAVAMDSTTVGDGYWVATADGAVFAFGAARFRGSASGLPLGAPIVDFAATNGGDGYWLAGADGGVLAYGQAEFFGSAGGVPLAAPVVAFQPTRFDDGYWLGASDGGVFAFPGSVPRPPRIRVETFVSGLDIPWDLGFLPDGTMLFTERDGLIEARVVGGGVRVLAAPSDVYATGEGGMLGLAVDPLFSGNRLVYTCFNTTHGDIRVVKWRVNDAVTALTRVADIVTGIPASAGGRHSGCRPRFGPDGYLWVGTGDAADGVNPQSDGSLGGKVLRIDRDGRAAPGNPFGFRWYTKGHRNVQGIAFQPGTGAAFSVEHGPDRDDEVNVLRSGGNYGWDPVPGYDESVPMTDTGRHPSAVRAVWRSGYPTIAPSGATFLSGSRWGTWNGGLVMAVLKDAHLRLLRFDASNRLTGEQVVLSGYGRLRTVVLGPDGNLYVTTSNGGDDRILRVVPS